MLGHDSIGDGGTAVIVLNDWMGDTSTWDGVRPYLDTSALRWIFADLRGYGRSRAQAGAFNADEAAADVIALADALGLARFALVGHSMSTRVVLRVLQQWPQRVMRAVLITPPAPGGMALPEGVRGYLRGLAMAGDDGRLAGLAANAGTRLSPQWLAYKVARWRACAEPRAAAAYVDMFGASHTCDGAPVTVPVLAITGEQDGESMRSAAVARAWGPLCSDLTVAPLADCGHYPMQEAPPLLGALVQRFVGEAA